MKIELAPMEGITSYIYRNALNKHYGGVDIYFTPFISTHKDKTLNFKEKKEISPDNNKGINLIPQVLTNNSDEFLFTASQIREYGYNHININFGCPSATVTTKGKGSGALRDILGIERFLDDVFSKTDMKISIKTRMGYESSEEWTEIAKVYEKFPIEEIIVHARVREDFYNGMARRTELASLGIPNNKQFSYNGDIYEKKDLMEIEELFPGLYACMIGRGIITDPSLAARLSGKVSETYNITDEIGVFKAFEYELVEKYSEIMPGEKNTLFKMKELWTYQIQSFENDKKLLKSIKKSNSLREYLRIIDSL